MDDSIQRIKQANELKASKALELQHRADMTTAFIGVQETILKSFTSLVNYLDNKVTKAEVVNQLRSVGTPDALKVVESVNSLHETLKTHENTDLSEITDVMRSILEEAKQIPKEIPEEKEQQFIDYSEQFESFIAAINAVETVVKEQKFIAEAPIVNVPETNVNVEAPDLKPLQQGFKDVVGAVKKIVIPEYKTDNKDVEKLLKASNKLLKQLLEKPVSSGGGGGSSWTAVNPTGIPMPLNLDADGNLLTSSPAPVGGATSAKQDELLAELQQKTEPSDIQNVEMINALRSLLQQIAMPLWYDPATNTLKVGTHAVTVSSGTVTNLTNFGTNAADVMARDISINTWANTVRSTIS